MSGINVNNKTYTFTNLIGATVKIDLNTVVNHCLVEDFMVPSGLHILQIIFKNDTSIYIEYENELDAKTIYDKFYNETINKC